MEEKSFINVPKNDTPIDASITMESPSNIALIKYWGKKEIQIPTNPSISFTLKNCKTTTTLFLKKGLKKLNNVIVDGKTKHSFTAKIEKYFSLIQSYCPFLENYEITISTSNTFPHSSGIASSASGFSALSMCIVQFEQKLCHYSDEFKFKKASFLSRIGSGSASRSIYGPMAIWGKNNTNNICSDLYATPHNKIHDVFKDFQDTVLLIDKGQKQVSSTVGHKLMVNHPYAKERFSQAKQNLNSILNILCSGNLEDFIQLVEHEALSLHAMMMTSNPYFILMKPGTIETIHKIWEFRKTTKTPLCFTLDAGANVHLLYPKSESNRIMAFVEDQLIGYCENQQYICDEIGTGPKLIEESYD
ncbi:MAG: diphosphomevalonate decarboxylase [Crocinitomicaceae bacterium]|nr:diphosphomevalonate decarboxylase [Crocinitomicaceae bacterium]|tara:strand:+ start:6435 stop:7514 length:1080 start_codon:yes stop_codon:yes gene_type:complete